MYSNQIGSSRRPIQVLDEDQEIKQNEEKVQFERNRQALYRAHMGSNFDVLVAVIKLQIKGSDEEKEKVLKNRIRRFFSAQSKEINVETEHFRKKRQPDYSDVNVEPVPNQLVLFGVDFISTKQIKQKFTGLNPQIIWLDDSNCKLKFSSHEEAKKGIEMNLKNKNETIVKLQNDQMQLPRGWFELQSYYYLTFERKLSCRYAANNQNQLQIKRSNDYYMYQQAKKQFQQSLKEQITQDKYYQIMTKYRFIDEHKIRERRQRFSRNRDDGQRNQRYKRDNQTQRGGSRFRDRDQRGNGRYEDRNRGRQWDNNSNRNRDYNFKRNNQEQYQNRQQQEQCKRSRQKNQQKNKRDFDDISIISRADSRASRQRRPRKQSLSICSNDINNSPRREVQQNFSFILGEQQLSNSQQIVNHMNNLSISYIDNNKNPERKVNNSYKEEDLNLSYISDSPSPMKKKKQASLSINANNLSFQNEINNENSQDMRKKKALDTSIMLNENNERNIKPKKIQLITLYDDEV